MPRLLTDRQADVLRLLCAGTTRAEAARALGITPNGIGSHLAEARARLGPGTIAELCARASADIAAAERLATDRPTAPHDPFTGCRVEHRPPDGPPRLLAESTSRPDAIGSAKSWLGLLGRQGRTGEVAVVDAATGEALYAYPIPRERRRAEKPQDENQASP